MSNEMRDEDIYFATRAEQLADKLESRRAISRRRLLAIAGTAPLLAGSARLLAAPAPAKGATPATSPILKPLPPDWFVQYGSNAEMRWDSVAGQAYTTTNDRFFVRNHTSTPTIDPDTWQLNVFGDGLKGARTLDSPVAFTLDDLERLPSKTVTAFIECAGNGRSFFGIQQGTPAPGSQWGLGAVGVAQWTGVPLAEVLERAGITRAAVDVLPQGLDPNFVSAGADPGKVRRPLSVTKALDDALLAYEMNGATLPADHGFPLRLVVPGWVGVASTKWLGQIQVSKSPLTSPFSTTLYRFLGPTYAADTPPLTAQAVKSAFELARGATLPALKRRTLTGRSWSGRASIGRVDVSIDQGKTWLPTRLHGPNAAGTWVRWDFTLPPEPAGTYELWARATDTAGRVQPATVPFNTNGYLFWAIVKHPIALK